MIPIFTQKTEVQDTEEGLQMMYTPYESTSEGNLKPHFYSLISRSLFALQAIKTGGDQG